jgi:hypothetical protein
VEWALNALSTVLKRTSYGAESEQVRISYFSYGVALTICNNLAFDNFTGVHPGSVKEPDHFLRVDTDPVPRIVVESGWSESFTHLRSDKNLRLKDNPSVVLVILLKWSALYSRIKGTAEIWRRDTTGYNFLTTMVIIYSHPQCDFRPEADIH